ncbi:hypothetical protein IT407_01885 [Candidatus Uhrbacteria bacterium]|nr:hypothetical protein [Candidatus Uhrbacteria bacterium]
MHHNRYHHAIHATFRHALMVVAAVSLIVSTAPLSSFASANRASYAATVISVPGTKTLGTGERAMLEIVLKNSGTTAWLKDGKNFVSLYHYNPVKKIETTSVLSTVGWDADDRPSKLPVDKVQPGETATFRFPIAAPSVPGTYKGEFVLVAENLVRMAGSRFSITVVVNKTSPVQSTPTPTVQASAPGVISVTDTPVSTGGKWNGQLISKSGTEWQIEMEQNVFVELKYKNTGTETWKRSEGAFVSLYATEAGTSGSKERTSLFKDLSWKGNMAARLVEAEVKPGGVGTFKLELRAPRQPGKFIEEFMLAAEKQAWMGATRVQLPITVPNNAQYIASIPAGSDMVTTIPSGSVNKGGTYAATVLLRSAESISLTGNARQQLTFGFKNTGSNPWSRWNLTVKGVQPASVGSVTASVRDDSWKEAGVPASVTGATKPGELGFLTFTLKVPAKKGQYTAKFQLYADGQAVEGGEIEIPITVTADGYIEPEPVPTKPTPSNPNPAPPMSPSVPNQPAPALNPQPLTGDVASLPNEPLIRAGLLVPSDNEMTVTARYAPLSVFNNGSKVCSIAMRQSVSIRYDRASSNYSLSGGDCSGTSRTWYVVKADDGISPMEMTDYTRPVSWLPGANDNSFRAHLELRYASAVDQVWVINELPVEWYLKGIAETSNVSPGQYQRALLTAARTYAMYHVQRGTKHAARNFTIDATYDQVYRGYGQEARSPTIVAAVEATRGQIVTYQGKLAITPYFSRSDGRTRSWGEVWYGGSQYPWLVSVSVPDDVGKTLWGHGVGMSATGALQMDAKHKMTYDKILSHFYTGTELRRVYK